MSKNKQGKWSKYVQQVKAQSSEVMYTFDGARFQEEALSQLDYAHSFAHESIGRLVRAINNGQLDRDLAETIYVNLLDR